ncbi:MAG: hypothetical protein P4L40_24060 [Terracidiphilus sp.]|nr:hypothetical protein [Terracidiphilus sp.]
MRAACWPRFTVRRATRAIVLAASTLGLASSVPAQTAATASTTHTAKHRKPRTAAKQTVEAAVPAPVAPPAPNWPANNQPGHAAISWDSRRLRIEASNSSLLQILSDVASATGTRIEGAGADQRVFGSYGPGTPRDVLAQLLQGSGYNILMIGDSGQGLPREVVLTARGGGGSAPSLPGRPQYQPQSQADDDNVDDTPAPEPEPPQPAPVPPDPNHPTPDAQENQQRQQLLQQGQQPTTQPNN